VFSGQEFTGGGRFIGRVLKNNKEVKP